MPSPDDAFLTRVLGRARREPARVFAEIWIGEHRETLTWGDLGRRAAAFADVYRREGVRRGDIVFLILKHGPDLYPAFLGAMLIGAVPSFLPFPSAKQDPDLYWASHLAVFRRTSARLLVTYAELADIVRGQTDEAMRVIDAATVSDGAVLPDIEVDEAAVALLQHSSGTTGLKKGVALSYRAIRLQLDAYAGSLGLDPATAVIASWLPLYHDMGLIACFMLPLYLGVRLVSLDAFEWTMKPALLLAAIETSGATHVWLPNFAFAHIARATSKRQTYRLGSLRALIGCSEPNKPVVFDSFAARFAAEGVEASTLQTCYAMAETVFAVSQSTPGIAPRRLAVTIDDGVVTAADDPHAPSYLSNGRALPGVEVRAMRDGKLHGAGVAGEICVRAPFLFEGYYADAHATEAAFTDGFFRTGDLGFVHDDELYIFGRTKELIIVNGRNFFAGDIEAIAMEADGVKKGRCVAFGLYVPAFGAEQIVVVAERDTAGDAGDAGGAVTRALNARIGMAPGDVRIVEPGWLVKTTSGKISRAENIRKYVASFQPDLAPAAIPETSA